MRTLTVVLTVTLISLLSACATKDSILPVPEHDMKDVYDRHMQGIGGGQLYDTRSLLRRPKMEGDNDLSYYVRTEKTQLQARFKTLPNPTMYVFVAPHLAADTQVPIPGYLTEFKMWEQEHYALPGEVSDMENSFGGQ
ncbi:TIGR03751 family conjugal transfer lipoprotein (plasmid) [Microbulbifer sp. TRSA002]|uniref:TIGR03751 family conjugal transfer lipoprotein n=1 Tax=Microbulbifer sp. TRSA002 TaxID=3243382 RepID=UPI004039B9B8